MATMQETLAARGYPALDVEWLRLLVGDWQLVADLSFADLVLWLPTGEGQWQAMAHVRPTTGQMVFVDDRVGDVATRAEAQLLEAALSSQRIVRDRDPHFQSGARVREEAVPVVRQGRAMAVVTRHTNLTEQRTPSRLELTYYGAADALLRMVAGGDFPHPAAPAATRRGAPRVGDGVIRIDEDGVIAYASPNAVSALHRLGFWREVVDASLAEVVTSVMRDTGPVDEGLAFVLTGRQPWITEVEGGGAVVTMRAIPLLEAGQRFGAIVLVRDVTELRRRERELLTKDATIREVHHRVKNNLQSVAALLRLQGRRLEDTSARAALQEAERRVGTIALVHEMLSQGFEETVDFDAIAAAGLRALTDVSGGSSSTEVVQEGSFGRVVAEDATPLALVVAELAQNALEHGSGPEGLRLHVSIDRAPAADGRDLLTVRMVDEGPGLVAGRVGTGLGTQIVRSFVADMGGEIHWADAPPHGTAATFTARLRRPPG